MMKNTQWKWCHRSLLSAAVFAVICVYSMAFIDGMEGGFAIAFISLFLAITSIAVAALFFHHARVMDFILKSERPLAHWTYSALEAEESARREYREYQERNRTLFFVVGGMLVIATVIMMAFFGEAGFTTGLVLLGVTVFTFIVSRLAPALVLRNALKSSKEAYIADNGIIYEGAVYPFQSFMMRMDEVSFTEGDGSRPPLLVFSFIQLVGNRISSHFEIQIPVPRGEEDKAAKIAEMVAMDRG